MAGKAVTFTADETRRAYLPSERQQTPAQLLEQYTQRYCVE